MGISDRRNGLPKPQTEGPRADADDVNTRGLRRVLLLAFGSPSMTVEIHDPDDAGELIQTICARQAESARSLLDVAASPRAPLDELRYIAELSKRLLKAANSSREAEAARLLHLVSVAAAAVRFSVDLEERPTAERVLMYERLSVVFSGHAIGEVFRLAGEMGGRDS